MMNTKILFLIMGKTGSGKDTFAKTLQGRLNVSPIVSYTTATPRSDQKDGVEHYFISDDVFDELIQKEPLLAYAESNTHYGIRYAASMYQLSDPVMSYVINPKSVVDRNELFFKHIPVKVVPVYIYAPYDLCVDNCSNRGVGVDKNMITDRLYRECEEFRTYLPKIKAYYHTLINDGSLEQFRDQIDMFIRHIVIPLMNHLVG